MEGGSSRPPSAGTPVFVLNLTPMSELYNPGMMPYITGLLPARHPILIEMEERAEKDGFPIVGAASGQFCYMIAKMIGARSVFELGSGYGYSTAWFARAVRENGGGKVHHVVWHEDLSKDAQSYLDRLGYGDMVEYHFGEAVAYLKDQTGTFDLIFNDIDKEGYPGSIPLIKERLNPGGVLIVDNILWSGRVFDSEDQSDATVAIRKTAQIVFDDPEFAASIVPLRDGLLVARYQPK